eukprot:6475746-Amphidinium_carterae.2
MCIASARKDASPFSLICWVANDMEPPQWPPDLPALLQWESEAASCQNSWVHFAMTTTLAQKNCSSSSSKTSRSARYYNTHTR